MNKKKDKLDKQKQEFLDAVCESERARMVYGHFFYGIAKREQSLGKDLCEMTFDEFKQTMRCLKQTRITMMQQTISTARAYLDWCEQHHYGTQNYLRNQGTINDLIALICTDDEDLITHQDILSAIGRMDDKEGRREWYKAFLLCIYEGVEDGDMENLIRLGLSAISGNNIRIYNGKRIPITNELKNALFDAASLTQMDVASHGSEKIRLRELRRYKSWQPEDAIFKGVNHAPDEESEQEKLYRLKLFRKCFRDLELETKKMWSRDSIRRAGLWFRFTEECARRGENLYEDMRSLDNPVTATNKNKDIVYTSILTSLQSSLKWSEWLEMYVNWAPYLEDDENYLK